MSYYFPDADIKIGNIEDRLDVYVGGQIMTLTKGDLISDNGGTTTILSLGTNNQVLRVNTSTTVGMQWDNISSIISMTSDATTVNTSITTSSTVSLSSRTISTNGRYYINFSTVVDANAGGGTDRFIIFSIRIGTNIPIGTIRDLRFRRQDNRVCVSTNCITNLTAGDTIEAICRRVSAETFVVYDRNLSIVGII